ncbi:hypothetical protein [Geomicrobium sp. JCM 19039]|uniref:hypothetical protein n=1 Tax=Geomicrobium sp. JCM 19039 TaxID=1460636 RepID=UPI0005A60EDF|nr:hypothetical protein [Geomicrobium sp. JCM 19039]
MASAYTIQVNGVSQPTVIYGDSIAAGAQNLDQQLVGSGLLSLPAGAIVTLNNAGTTPDTLPDEEDGVDVLNASITINKLSL